MDPRPTAPSIRALRVWQRFHVRIGLLYGAAFLAVFTLLGALLYDAGVDAEQRGLTQRLRAMTALIAADVSAPVIEALRSNGPEAEAMRGALRERAAAMCAADPDVSAVYMMLRTEDQGWLRIVWGYDPARPDAPNNSELYDARELPVMLRGLTELAVEDRPYRDRFGLTLSGYAPLRGSAGASAGLVGVDVEVGRLSAMRARVRSSVGGALALGAALLVPLALLVGRAVRRPVEELIRASAALAEGRFETRLALARRDELGLLARHFDAMAAGLEERERIRATFGRYLGRDVARALLADPDPARLGGEERDVTVLFSDLSGYSTVSEHLAPRQVVEVLNTYIEAMTEEIEAERGVYLEFLGDGFLAVFGAPNDLPDAESAAVRCAAAMRRRLAALNDAWERSGVARLWQERGVARLAARIGVHRGVVVAGNVGGRQQARYSVVGDAVNVAARLEALNKELGTEILASQEVVARLHAELAARAAPRGEHRVKGREQPIAVYAL